MQLLMIIPMAAAGAIVWGAILAFFQLVGVIQISWWWIAGPFLLFLGMFHLAILRVWYAAWEHEQRRKEREYEYDD